MGDRPDELGPLLGDRLRPADGRLIARVDADLEQHLDIGYSDVDALIHLSVADDHTLRMERDALAAMSHKPLDVEPPN